MEKTLSIVKPDAVSKNVIGKILDRFESAGLKVSTILKDNSNFFRRFFNILF